MNVNFLSNNPLNSVVEDAATGRVLYNIVTPFKVGKRMTTIYDASGHEVAVYKHRWGHDQIELRGQKMDASDWLAKDGIFTRFAPLIVVGSSMI